VSIITVNYNGYEDTCALIDSIPSDDPSLEVIVVDNASDRDEAALIAEKYPYVRIVRSKKNLGFAGGNNMGIKVARGRYLFLINNDTVFNSFDIQALVARLDSSDNIAVACPKIKFTWGNNIIQFAGYSPLSRITVRNRTIGFGEEDKGQYDIPHPTPYAHGAAMMLKREAIEKTGLMPECYFLYYEEIDWSIQFRRAGYEIWYEPACTVFHKESRSTGQNSPLKTYYMTRNRLLLVKRNKKGAGRYISYGYLMLTVAPKEMLKYAINGRKELAKATRKGVINFLKL